MPLIAPPLFPVLLAAIIVFPMLMPCLSTTKMLVASPLSIVARDASRVARHHPEVLACPSMSPNAAFLLSAITMPRSTITATLYFEPPPLDIIFLITTHRCYAMIRPSSPSSPSPSTSLVVSPISTIAHHDAALYSLSLSIGVSHCCHVTDAFSLSLLSVLSHHRLPHHHRLPISVMP